jgi:hypothetical protein
MTILSHTLHLPPLNHHNPHTLRRLHISSDDRAQKVQLDHPIPFPMDRRGPQCGSPVTLINLSCRIHRAPVSPLSTHKIRVTLHSTPSAPANPLHRAPRQASPRLNRKIHLGMSTVRQPPPVAWLRLMVTAISLRITPSNLSPATHTLLPTIVPTWGHHVWKKSRVGLWVDQVLPIATLENDILTSTMWRHL